MLPASTIETLRSLEADFPVHTWRIDGIAVWPIVRMNVGFNLLGEGRAPERMARSTPRVRALEAREIARTLAAKLRDAPNDVQTIPRADVVTLSNPGNRTRVGDVYWDRYFDPIADLLDARSLAALHLEYHDAGVAYRLPRRRPSLLVRPSVSTRQAKAALRRTLSRPPELDGYDDFARTVFERTGVRVLPRLRVAERLWAIEYASRYFDAILARTAARLVLCSCYYSLVAMALCLAAHRRGVPCADVQHGVTHLNPAYHGWTRFPEGGYELLPSWFWAWCERDAAPVRAWPAPATKHHRALGIGHPWAALFQSNGALAVAFERDVAALRGPSLNVLVALSTTTGLSTALQRAIEAGPRDWTWWLRLHPLMHHERTSISSYAKSRPDLRIVVDAPTDLPLPLLLSKADVLVTHTSTVIQEAAAFGLPSVAVDTLSREMFAEEVASGWVQVAEEENVVPALLSQSEHRGQLPNRNLYPSYEELSAALSRFLGDVGARR